MRKQAITLFFFVFCVSAFQIWTDTDRIGDVQAITGQAVAIADGEKRVLTRDSKLYVKDVLAVGEKGFLQVIFKDGTVLSLDENSEVELRQFVFDMQESENNVVDLNMIAGGMRFLTGKVTKKNPEAFKFETPLGTIGIRGTEGTTTTELSNSEEYSQSLNSNINGPGSAWGHQVKPDVTSQNTQHVNGTSKRAMTFTDRFGKTVSMDRGESVDVSKATGTSDPQPIGTPSRQLAKPTTFKTNVNVPKDVRRNFSGFERGGDAPQGVTGGSGNALEPAAPSSSDHSGQD
ncbi:MAG: FecR family protein [Proteobacteria bacterium]|nr:FecR family protein [Pseudomonadota bacterium]MBU1611066.1 FecR family protein [Pseudomonadota bacterium]